jgi:hypothetical protein
VDEEVSAGLLLKKVSPDYSPQLLQNGIERDVVLRVRIGIDGRPTILRTVSGDPALREAARNAVLQWRYMTYQSKGQACEMISTVHVEFQSPKSPK